MAARKGRARRTSNPAAQPVERRSSSVLLLVDFMNPLSFDGGAKLAPRAIAAAKRTVALKRRCADDNIPVIYANDNFGRWDSQFSEVVRSCLDAGDAAAELAKLLMPEEGDLSVLKPRHSAFYGTPLEFLLKEIGAEVLIVAGLATDSCVLFTACDAFLRNYRVWVPNDCSAAETPLRHRRALAQIESAAKVWTGASSTPIRNAIRNAERNHA